MIDRSVIGSCQDKLLPHMLQASSWIDMIFDHQGARMSVGDWIFSSKDVAATLPTDPEVMKFAYALRHGTMKVGLYAPVGEDNQTPHKQDELYVIVSGSGFFEKEGERRPFASNDIIFVPAGEDHRFVDFTADFTAWVIFWGVEGGERGAGSRVS